MVVPSSTAYSYMISAALCLVAIFVAWYTMRKRIKLSQMILGIFAYVLVLILDQMLAMVQVIAGAPEQGIGAAVVFVVCFVAAREVVRFLALRLGLIRYFSNTDSAVGFAIGFAGAYLVVCAVYYFNCYTIAMEYLSTSEAEFAVNAGSDLESAMELLQTIGTQSMAEVLLTGLNRVFFLVREISLSVLLWYAVRNEKDRLFYLAVPVFHLIAVFPDGLYQAGILESSIVENIAVIVLAALIAAFTALVYNRREELSSHYDQERLRARRIR